MCMLNVKWSVDKLEVEMLSSLYKNLTRKFERHDN